MNFNKTECFGGNPKWEKHNNWKEKIWNSLKQTDHSAQNNSVHKNRTKLEKKHQHIENAAHRHKQQTIKKYMCDTKSSCRQMQQKNYTKNWMFNCIWLNIDIMDLTCTNILECFYICVGMYISHL